MFRVCFFLYHYQNPFNQISALFVLGYHLRHSKQVRSMAAIPASGSLVATHDYYRSKNAPVYVRTTAYLTGTDIFENVLFMSPSVCSQGALALHQVAARVAVRNTPGRLFHITQVCFSSSHIRVDHLTDRFQRLRPSRFYTEE